MVRRLPERTVLVRRIGQGTAVGGASVLSVAAFCGMVGGTLVVLNTPHGSGPEGGEPLLRTGGRLGVVGLGLVGTGLITWAIAGNDDRRAVRAYARSTSNAKERVGD